MKLEWPQFVMMALVANTMYRVVVGSRSWASDMPRAFWLAFSLVVIAAVQFVLYAGGFWT